MGKATEARHTNPRRQRIAAWCQATFVLGLTIFFWAEIMDLSWYWKAPIVVVNLWSIGLVITSYMGGRLEKMEVAMVRSLMDQAQYAQALSVADRALRAFPESKEIQALRQECRARVTALSEGAGISTGLARRYSQDPWELERTSRALGLSTNDRFCAECGAHYTNFARTGAPAVGGAKCRSCGNFYCEPCVAGALGVGSAAGGMTCACGQARASLDSMGDLALANFDELVVYPAAR